MRVVLLNDRGGGLAAFSFLSDCWVSSRSKLSQHKHCSSTYTVGTLLGFTFVEPEDLQDIHTQVSVMMSDLGVSVPQLPDLDFSHVEAEWKRIRSSIPEVWKFNNDGREFQVGESFKARGLDAEFPVILIPGIISTVRHILRCLVFTELIQPPGTGVLVNITGLSCLLP